MEKASQRVRQVRIVKASETEPLLKCRNAKEDIRTGVQKRSRDEPEGYLSTALAVSGMKRARARSRLCMEQENLSFWNPRLVGGVEEFLKRQKP